MYGADEIPYRVCAIQVTYPLMFAGRWIMHCSSCIYPRRRIRRVDLDDIIDTLAVCNDAGQFVLKKNGRRSSLSYSFSFFFSLASFSGLSRLSPPMVAIRLRARMMSGMTIRITIIPT